MKQLSDQLTELAARAKQAEDFVNGARSKNRAYLDSQRETLKASIDGSKAKVAAGATAAQAEAESWWGGTRSAIEDRFASLRAEHDEHRAERDLKKAENRADDAEQDAEYAVDFAISMLDQAEYLVADAVIARAEADDVAAKQAG
jgi:hypothetical protein